MPKVYKQELRAVRDSGYKIGSYKKRVESVWQGL